MLPSARIHAKLGMLLGDETALHAIWQCKGSSGTKACCVCMNIVGSWHAVDEIGDGHFLKDMCDVMRLSDCVSHTKETILYC